MALKSQNAGLFGIPTNPSVGTGVVQSGSANTFGSFVTVQASGSLGALYVTGVAVNVTTSSSLHTGKYCAVQVATGASGSETVVGEVVIPTPGIVPATNAKYGGYRDFDLYPIPVAANTRIACKTASDTAAAIVWNVSLKAILQANVGVDTALNENVNVININGTAQTARDIGASVLLSSGTGSGQVVLNSGAVTVSSGTVTSVSSNVSGSVGSVTGLTASNLDATISSRMATYTQPTGFLTATFPSTVASPTNITAGTITSVSSNVSGSVGSVVGLTASNLDATISSRLASTAYTAPSNSDITAIKAKTDSLTFTVANQADVNIKSVTGITVTGVGTDADPWGP